MEFENAIDHDIVDPAGQFGLSLSLGCRDMVLADIRTLQGYSLIRLVSVLEDGLVIATLSANRTHFQQKQFGTAALWNVHSSDQPREMLSAHLEQVVTMAEQRDAAVETLEQDDIQHVFRYANRGIAAVQSRYGDALPEVQPAQHGRFSFPPPVMQVNAPEFASA